MKRRRIACEVKVMDMDMENLKDKPTNKPNGYENLTKKIEFLHEHYGIEEASMVKISDIFNHFCGCFPKTSTKAFGICIRKAFPSITKKNSNSCAFYTNIKRQLLKNADKTCKNLVDVPVSMALNKALFSSTKRHVMDGATSSVFVGKYNDTTVCIKQYKADVTEFEVLNEFKILISIPASEYFCFLVGVCLETPRKLVTSFFGSEFPGKNTLDYHIRNKDLALNETGIIIRKLLTAVSFLHSNKIFHGDIKPNNILIKKNLGNVQLKLIDFGCASFIRDKECEIYQGMVEDNKTKLICRCNKHIAPEVHYGFERSSYTDLYGIGYSCLKIISSYQEMFTPLFKPLRMALQPCMQLDPYKRSKVHELQMTLNEISL